MLHTGVTSGSGWRRVRGRSPLDEHLQAQQLFAGHARLFYLQGRELAPQDWTVMLDKAQEADPVILGLLERHRGGRIIVGNKY